MVQGAMMFTLGWRGLKEGTVLCSTNLRHAEEKVYLFCVTSEAGVETIYGIFCYKVYKYVYLGDRKLC